MYPSLKGQAVLGESCRVASVGDSFTDTFAPMAVHICYAGPAKCGRFRREPV
jgi:hypothetical protein